MLDRTPCQPFVDHDEFVGSGCCPVPDEATEADTELARLAASEILANLSGWTVTGICEATVRPAGSIQHPVQCLPAVMLEWPVREVLEVRVDGEVVDPTTYAIMDDTWLVRLRGEGVTNCGWPKRPRLDLPVTERHTFVVTYTFGSDVPQYAKDAAIELACDILRGCAGEGCDIPNTATSIATQGVSYSLRSAMDEVHDAADRAFPAVQRFLALTNPTRQPQTTSVWTPDVPGLHALRPPLTPQP